ncbi:hypothetical protein ABWK22_01690 [Gottfriedia acidiceleris]|uniref:hypothetical protein n=1 Tax=Gottfriedia acidiceleris TaxID=371036 RepID=UPI0033980B53
MGRTKEKVSDRKIRSDKKKDVKPTVNLGLYDCVSRISFITNTPMKDVGEVFCTHGLYSEKVIEYLSKNFRRDYTFNSTIYRGNRELLTRRVKQRSDSTTRVTIRFTQEVADKLADLAYALDTTVSTATALLLNASIKNTDIVNEYVLRHVEETLDAKRMRQLYAVLEYVRKQNPYSDEEITMSQLVSYIMDGFQGQKHNAKLTIESWLDKNTE